MDNPIVCDNGTGYVKVGYAGCNFPKATFPSVVGRPLLKSDTKYGLEKKKVTLPDIVYGDMASKYRNYLEMTFPMTNGVVSNWDDMKLLWDYTFEEVLELKQDDYAKRNILLTEPPLNPMKNREKMAEHMFETYGFNGIQVQIQALLTLYAQGLLTGVVVDSGDGVTHVCPVADGYGFPNLTERLDVAGRTVTRYLIKLLQLRGYNFNVTADFDAVREIKEALCYVAYDMEEERKLALETTCLVESYTLPDKRQIKIGRERYEAPEILFRPSLVDVEGLGMGELLFKAINGAAIDLRSELYKHIVLSGGTTMYPGLPSRLDREMKQLYLTRILKGDTSRLGAWKVRIEDPPRRKHLVFSGGAVLADIMKEKPDFWLQKKSWDEEGPRSLRKIGNSR